MLSSIEEVKAKSEEQLLTLPGVVSVGIGRNTEGDPAIIVGLDGVHPESESQIPQSLHDYPVVIKVTGSVKAQ